MYMYTGVQNPNTMSASKALQLRLGNQTNDKEMQSKIKKLVGSNGSVMRLANAATGEAMMRAIKVELSPVMESRPREKKKGFWDKFRSCLGLGNEWEDLGYKLDKEKDSVRRRR